MRLQRLANNFTVNLVFGSERSVPRPSRAAGRWGRLITGNLPLVAPVSASSASLRQPCRRIVAGPRRVLTFDKGIALAPIADPTSNLDFHAGVVRDCGGREADKPPTNL